ncbi:MAG: 1-aminocyclopropane-1-carboxylate deaminase/D-cysteine desulfhydrase [Polyangiaceae bacterium]
MTKRLPRLQLVHSPTPLVRRASLDELVGAKIWIKRDDATAGAESGNKVRKLEFLLADAVAKGRDTVLTCGGIQSNHARATAICCAQLGLKCVLYLRDAKGAGDPARVARAEDLPVGGNVILDRLAGAEIHLVTPAEYAQRVAILESEAQRIEREGGKPYVIPEGGSNGLGSLGYVEAMRETREQMDLGIASARVPFDEIVHACGSGGTAAGVVLGAGRFDVAKRVRAVAVCDDAAYFERTIDRVIVEARGHDPSLTARAPLVVDESSRGPGYGVMNAEQKDLLARVARASGTILDPVYTGKAMHALVQAVARGDVAKGSRVLFLHTGGLPGLLAQAADI